MNKTSVNKTKVPLILKNKHTAHAGNIQSGANKAKLIGQNEHATVGGLWAVALSQKVTRLKDVLRVRS